ncbi:hypothetical protein K1719_046116 [Acacia pycnantha]|nr:hypothetical protein K1719_046116 [Acacia pycnantha]
MLETIISVLLAKKGHFLQALQTSRDKQVWIANSGASDHMIDCHQLFTTYVPCVDSQKVKIVDSSLAPITGKENIQISEFITLESVLHCSLRRLVELGSYSFASPPAGERAQSDYLMKK